MSNKVNEALITAKSTFDKAKDNFYSKKDKNSARSKRNTELFSAPVMTYALLDSMHYRFTYDFERMYLGTHPFYFSLVKLLSQ